MDEKIHQILQQAGAAKGITPDEVKMLFVLGNDDLFNNFIGILEQSLDPEEFEHVKAVFEEEKKNIQAANEEYAQGLKNIEAEIKTDIFEEKVQQMAKIHPDDLVMLTEAIESL